MLAFCDVLHSLEALPAAPLKQAGAVSAEFLALGITDYRAAARYVRELPYGRNSDRRGGLDVLREHRGTCSTKHALLAELAREQAIPVALMVGLYEMTEANTPGVGAVLHRHGIERMLEAHCYLNYRGTRIDVTRIVQPAEPIESFLHEEKISPDQIAEYKVELHRRKLREWITAARLPGNLSFDQAWRIREECIAALGR